ncbi:diguanylate cyclase [Pelomonas cellulosilytica]|uniref:diguanylate cyclase n=1 Tax=Pelomonas cellulosilytica TaxID=2906762 RepID=A0ABS8XVH6_9BURK|nr:diguanylate cyclase [Pelomonas sp. P8]MCE4554892.1 diguanylate cyclase [Pelomonas sp. P8]
MMQLSLPEHTPLQPGQSAPGRRPRLLVVDDQPANIQALHRVFAADCQVLMATHGARALQLCRERQPDVVLLDVQMPGMDGHELCAELKADPLLRAIAVIFVTSQDRPEDETRALDAGAADFITKPFNPTVVRARVRTQLTLKAQSDLLRTLAFVDGLTGVYNRRHFDERFLAESGRAQRTRSPLGVALADVDHFKHYNDALGHLAGDDCLRRVAGTLRACLRRPTDLLARYGGEEFVCLLPDTDLAGAIGVAQLMEERVRSLALPHPGVGGCVTISLGVSAGCQADGLVEAADKALYIAKAAGRGRVSWVGS